MTSDSSLAILQSPPMFKPRVTSTNASISPPPSKILLYCDHLVDSIVENTDRKTKVVLLRTSRLFFEAVAPHLYFSIIIGRDEGSSLFRGVYGDNKPYKKYNARLGKTSRPPISTFKFKAALLTHTRVVTLEGPHSQWCCMNPRSFTMLFPAVDIVRFGPLWRASDTWNRIDFLCNRECRFAQLPRLRKVVFPGYSYERLPYTPAFVLNFAHVEEVVFVIPLKKPPRFQHDIFFYSSRRGGSRAPSPGFLNKDFLNTDLVKVVLWDEYSGPVWDRWRVNANHATIAYKLNMFARRTQCPLHIYGLERTVHPKKDMDSLYVAEQLNFSEKIVRKGREDGTGSHLIKFFTMEEYLENQEARQGEVTPW